MGLQDALSETTELRLAAKTLVSERWENKTCPRQRSLEEHMNEAAEN